METNEHRWEAQLNVGECVEVLSLSGKARGTAKDRAVLRRFE